jgi:hypothetical protein
MGQYLNRFWALVLANEGEADGESDSWLMTASSPKQTLVHIAANGGFEPRVTDAAQ